MDPRSNAVLKAPFVKVCVKEKSGLHFSRLELVCRRCAGVTCQETLKVVVTQSPELEKMKASAKEVLEEVRPFAISGETA